jgi:hypothetical protein
VLTRVIRQGSTHSVGHLRYALNRDVRFGSLTDIAAALPNARFTPADSTGQRNTF